jgi:uncharacterized protein YutE (UPF0331/DUF86 family)/predicted nucleotidyltransferase
MSKKNEKYKDLIPILEKDKRVKFAYLFGSRARGKAGPLSDTDVAVYFDRRIKFGDYRLNLMERLAKILKSDNLDLVVLNQAPPLLKHEIIKYGRLLKDDTSRRIPFEAEVIRECLDTAYLKTPGKELHLVRKDLVAIRLEKLRNYIKTLKAIRKFDIQTFKKDVFVRTAAERYLHLSIECLLDLGSHILSDRGCRTPDTYSEIFEILAEEGVLTTTVLKELKGIAAFRNILVHDYLRLDSDQVYGILRDRIKTLQKLAKVYAALLE